VAAAAAATLGFTGSAFAQSGGTPPAGSGGTQFVPPPTIDGVKCMKACRSGNRVQGGGRIKLRGSELGDVREVVFRGRRGAGDDATVTVEPGSERRLVVPVPMRAQSGKVAVVAGSGASATAPKPLKVLPPAAPTPNPNLTPVPAAAGDDAGGLETATSRSLFAVDQRGGVKFSFRFAEMPPTSPQVTLVRLDDESVVKTWSPEVTAPNQKVTVRWRGLTRKRPARTGRYAFRIVTSDVSGARAANAASGDVTRDAFDLRPALFPIKGKHNYGQGGARFGAGRGDHSHQGQDVMAKCGTPLRAARGGRVKVKRYHSAAGNYLIIDGANTGVDYAYMHMAAPSAYDEGDRVRTGDQIGIVGQTGRAYGCHLHFEMWSSPGWYDGGSPFDPLPSLRAWDRYS
jgi:murein DD-endopeptidase MepM/ murein hydrolase activator NlpD